MSEESDIELNGDGEPQEISEIPLNVKKAIDFLISNSKTIIDWTGRNSLNPNDRNRVERIAQEAMFQAFILEAFHSGVDKTERKTYAAKKAADTLVSWGGNRSFYNRWIEMKLFGHWPFPQERTTENRIDNSKTEIKGGSDESK